MHARGLVTRRRLLLGLGAAGVAGAAVVVPRTRLIAEGPDRAVARQAAGYQPWLWNDPRAWGDGRVPGAGDVAVIDRPVVVEGDVSVAGVRIGPSGALLFSPHASTVLESTGNVVVQGQLVLRPRDAGTAHTLRFAGVREDAFVGGHTHHPLDSDVGLWVTGDGQLQARGADKLSWTRAAGGLSAGQTTIDLAQPAAGWQPGDTVVVVPTAKGSYHDYDVATVVSVSGSRVTLSAALQHHHPAFDHPASGTHLTAEVLNLSRNVRVEGTPSGRAHVQFLHATRPQDIAHVQLRHLGPRQPSDDGTTGVTGRYALHFHMSGDGVRGSTVNGVVARECGNHAFVPHLSNGVTFDRCVAYDIGGFGYWWDMPAREDDDSNQSHDVLYEECVSARNWGDPNSQARSLAGFNFSTGTGNAALGCVAVGVQGNTNSSGFAWPSRANHKANVWRFEDCTGHNNAYDGIFVWQNDNNPHLVDRFVGYRNGKAGVEHGAYGNPYRYRDIVLAENGGNDSSACQLLQHANARWNDAAGAPAGYERAVFDAAGLTTATITSARHKATATHPLEWIDCTFLGAPHVLSLDERDGGTPAQLHFVRAKVGPHHRDMEPADVEHLRNDNGTIIRVQRANGTAWQMNANGTVTTIPAFHAG